MRTLDDTFGAPTDWRAAAGETLVTRRLVMRPLRPEDAGEMVSVLSDDRLHAFTGGHPLSAAELERRYLRLAAGASPTGNEKWLNWIVRQRETGNAIGTVQATVTTSASDPTTAQALVAWIIGIPWQRSGFATESAIRLIDWLADKRVTSVAAHIHPEHIASQRVAARAGLVETATVVDGERVWERPGNSPARGRT